MLQESSNTDTCPICHETIELYGYGTCNHVTCGKCAIKLRKFENVPGQYDYSNCPTCRQKLGRIVIIQEFKPFDSLDTSRMIQDTELDLLFDSQESLSFFKTVMSCRCPECSESFPNMSALNRHTSMKHDLVYCDLCLRHARLLPNEFEPIPRDQLADHRKYDGRRGHPECEFCRIRFYDYDSLLQHMRVSHFMCDFCNRMRKAHFFKSQADMWKHFDEHHFVCNWCRSQDIMNVFATQIELQSHRVSDHRDQMTRGDASVPLPPSQRGSGNVHRGGRGGSRGRGGGRYDRGAGDNSNATNGNEPMELTFSQPPEFVPNPSDFPTLSGQVPAFPSNLQPPSENQVAPVTTVEDIRTAFASSVSAKPTTTLPATTMVTTCVERALIGEVSGTYSVAANKLAASRGILSSDDFPALGSSVTVTSSSAWGKTTSSVVPKAAPPISKTPKGQFASKREPIPQRSNEMDFPSLPQSRNEKADVVNQLQSLSLMKKKTPEASFKKTVKQSQEGATSKKTVKLSQEASQHNSHVSSSSNHPSVNHSTSERYLSTADDDYPELPSFKDDGRIYTAPPVAEPRITVLSPSLFATALNASSSAPTPKPQHVPTAPNVTSAFEFPDLLTTSVTPNNVQKDKQMTSSNKKKKTKGQSYNQAQNTSIQSNHSSNPASPDGCISMEDFTSRLAGVKYHPHEDFNARNLRLYSDIQQTIGKDQFDKLVQLATRYRNREMKPQVFLQEFKILLSEKLALSILPELVVLLDDIGLQRSIFAVLSKKDRGDLYECFHCGQVSHEWEKSSHMTEAHKS